MRSTISTTKETSIVVVTRIKLKFQGNCVQKKTKKNSISLYISVDDVVQRGKKNG